MDAIDYISVNFTGFRAIAKLFRFFELFLLSLLLAWLSFRLPLAAEISGDYFRRFAGVVVSPIFVFLIGNCIVVVLLAKSGLQSKSAADDDVTVTDLYEEISAGDSPESEEIVYQDKRIIVEESKTEEFHPSTVKEDESQPDMKDKLQRSEMVISRKGVAGGGAEEEEEEVSEEDFRRTIEAFIARQVRFHRQEWLAVVLHAQA